MTRNILIIEDRKPHMEALCHILNGFSEVRIFKAYNVDEAYYMLSSHHIHLFLVDIILDTKSSSGDVSGLEIVQKIRENHIYKFTPVVFITSLEDPKIIAYSQLHCFSYIEKPFNEAEVRAIVKEALEFPIVEDSKKKIYFRKEGIVFSIPREEIKYIECMDKKMIVVTERDRLVLARKKLQDMLLKLDSKEFLRCNRNVIINKKHIDYIDYPNKYIKIRGEKTKIEIGRKIIKQFKENMKND
ncbi:MAG: response regulator transcription factor [Lachnospiraceae bacterium]|nr:response regulator transcription factor [Lachnospiraceae bacterium]